MAFRCEDHFVTEIGILSVWCIIVPIQSALCVVALFQTKKSHKLSKLLFRAQCTFYLSALLFGISRLSNTIFYCFIPDLEGITHQMLNVTYSIHWVSLVIILYGRLIFVFKDTSHAIGKKTTYCIPTLIIICSMSACACILLQIFSSIPAQIMQTMIGFILIILIIIAQYLAWRFVFELKKLRKYPNDSVNIEVMKSVKKYSVLWVISVMFTTLYALGTLIVSVIFGGNTYATLETFAVIIALDVFVDTVCMTLSLKNNDKYYQYICICCVYNMNDNQIQLANVIATAKREDTLNTNNDIELNTMDETNSNKANTKDNTKASNRLSTKTEAMRSNATLHNGINGLRMLPKNSNAATYISSTCTTVSSVPQLRMDKVTPLDSVSGSVVQHANQ
eukprot:167307_1